MFTPEDSITMYFVNGGVYKAILYRIYIRTTIKNVRHFDACHCR